jgi:1,4-alpha-glucan branching enzyme
MFTYPGKKLMFMGCEFGQGREWNFDQALDWYVLDYPLHQGLHHAVKDLNQLYRKFPALYQNEFQPNGFEWIDCHDYQQSVISFIRRNGDNFIVVVLNFTPVPRQDYRLGVPAAGTYSEVFNSDSEYYAGSNVGNGGDIHSDGTPWMNHPHSLSLTLPPLAAIVLQLKTTD